VTPRFTELHFWDFTIYSSSSLQSAKYLCLWHSLSCWSDGEPHDWTLQQAMW